MRITDYTHLSDALAQLGVQQLRPQQEAPLEAICQGEDVLVVLPTGGGKSLLYQAPALMHKEQLTLVVSPLKALQMDQVKRLAAKGVQVALLNSDLSTANYRAVLKQAVARGGLLYLAPEQLQSERVREALQQADIACLVVDEAHILAQAKDDFRRAYGEIGEFISSLPRRPPLLALTATATHQDQKTIMDSLQMDAPKCFIYPLRRENLQLVIKRVEASGKQNKRETLRVNRFRAVESELRQRNKKGAAIIYCPTVKMVKQLTKWLKARGYMVSKYHGKMKRKAREKAQSLFLSGHRPIIVATNAFGLGIDKPDVRLIIHAGLPLSMDGYVQEIGRAGRDGKQSRCVLIYAQTDFAENEQILRKNGGETVSKKRKRLHALRKLLQSEQCIWQQIEQYFGQKKGKRCKKCCHCKRK